MTSPADAKLSPTSSALETLWKHVSRELVNQLGEAEFSRWFSPINLVRLDEEGLWFSAPNTIYSLWIEENYLTELSQAISLQLPDHPTIRFELAPFQDLVEFEASDKETGATPEEPVENRATVHAKSSVDSLFPPDPVDETISGGAAVEKGASPKPSKVDEKKWRTAGTQAGLSSDYQFDNFVVGTANRLANAAAKAVAEKPGRTYHPLFIHAASGLGKTHLLHAIGWDALKRRPRCKVVYISAERFANEYIEAIQKNDLVSFRKKFRQADMLLIDDIQFLSGKEGMQEEFFHTFNSLTDRHKQIVLASDRPATEIREIEDRLVSRFQWGMTAEIVAPTLETRIAILRRKRAERGAEVPDWILEFIANHITANVRAMEGALIRAATLASITDDDDQELDEQTLAELLVEFTDAESARQVGVHEIQELVADYFEINVRDITGRRRTSRLVQARHIAMALAREKTDLSLSEIGKEFGGRDHGTVINACRKVAQKAEEDPATRRMQDFLRRSLASHRSKRSRSGYKLRAREH